MSSPYGLQASLFPRTGMLALALLIGLGLSVLSFISPWLMVLGMAAGLTVGLAMIRPVLLCNVLIAVIAFTSGMARGVLIPYFIPNEIVLIFTAGIAFSVIFVRRDRLREKFPVLFAGMAILVVGTSLIPLLAYQVRGIPLSVRGEFVLLSPIQYVLLFWIFRNLPETDQDVRAILRWMVGCSVVISIVGFLQVAGVGFVLNLLRTLYSSSHLAQSFRAGRATSVLGAWNSLGTFMMLNLLLLRSLLGVRPKLVSKALFFTYSLLFVGCLLASGSYAGIIGLLLGLLILELYLPRVKAVLITIILSIPVLAFPLRKNVLQRFTWQFRGGLVPQTLDFRFKVWREVFWPIVTKNWLWGYNPVMPATLAWLTPESQYLNLLLRSGVFSLAAHIAWVALTLVWLRRKIRTTDAMMRSLALVSFTLLIVLSIMGFTNEVFTFSVVTDYLWIFLGLVAALRLPKGAAETG